MRTRLRTFVHSKHKLYQSRRLAWNVWNYNLMPITIQLYMEENKDTKARVNSLLASVKIPSHRCRWQWSLGRVSVWVVSTGSTPGGWVETSLDRKTITSSRIASFSPDTNPTCCACTMSIAIDLITRKDRTDHDCLSDRSNICKNPPVFLAICFHTGIWYQSIIVIIGVCHGISIKKNMNLQEETWHSTATWYLTLQWWAGSLWNTKVASLMV